MSRRSKDFLKTHHLTNCVRERLFKTEDNGVTVYILVTVSYHVIAGHTKHPLSHRIINITGLIHDLKLLRALDIIDDGAFESKLGVFTA
jgi:hypothetical protein